MLCNSTYNKLPTKSYKTLFSAIYVNISPMSDNA